MTLEEFNDLPVRQVEKDIGDELSSFTGDLERYAILPLNKKHVITPGVKRLIELADVHFLITDALLATLSVPALKGAEFLDIRFKLTELGGVFVITDGNDNVLHHHTYDLAIAGASEVKVWAARNELGGLTVMLPSEY